MPRKPKTPESAKSPIIKRSLVIGRHKTSVSLEDAFWNELRDIARAKRSTISDVVQEIDRQRQAHNLSSALRVFVLQRCREAATSKSMITMAQVAPPPA